MEPFDEAEFWAEYIAAAEQAVAEKARLEALSEQEAAAPGELRCVVSCPPSFSVVSFSAMGVVACSPPLYLQFANCGLDGVSS